jgi:hypothetical protein
MYLADIFRIVDEVLARHGIVPPEKSFSLQETDPRSFSCGGGFPQNPRLACDVGHSPQSFPFW